MKRKSILIAVGIAVLILAMVLPNSIPSGADSGVYPEGMVSYWKFDEGNGNTAYDSFGENNGGLINGPVWTSGKVGGALSFDGVDDYVRVDDTSNLKLSEGTILLWFNARGITGAYEEDFLFDKDAAGHTLGDLATGFTSSKLFYGFNNGYTTAEIRSNNTISNGRWYFVAVTFGSGGRKLYIDGIQQNHTNADINGMVNREHVEIGHRTRSGSAWAFDGLIDEVAIYDRALTAEEIQQHYQNGLKGLGYEVTIPATIDIDPDTLNLKSKGRWITCYIELPEDYNVGDIDVSTVMLNEQVEAEARPTGIGDCDEDGIADLMVKFSRSYVQEILETGDEVEITVSGEVAGTPFEGIDTIRVIDKGKK